MKNMEKVIVLDEEQFSAYCRNDPSGQHHKSRIIKVPVIIQILETWGIFKVETRIKFSWILWITD